MDFSKFKTHDWLVVGGGAVVLIFTFLKWWKVDLPLGMGSYGSTGFDHFFTGIVPWILLVGAASIVALTVLDKLPGKLPWPLIVLAATALGALLILINFLTSPGVPSGVDRGVGLYLSLVGGIVAAVGGVLGFLASGGDLKDLTDINKLKAEFTGDGAGAEGGSEMPPPPPPPPAG